MTAHGYVFDQAWTLERTRLAGLEVGAGAGTVARWPADLPAGGFDLVYARWLVHWLPDKREGLRRMAAALRPGGTLLVEEALAPLTDPGCAVLMPMTVAAWGRRPG